MVEIIPRPPVAIHLVRDSHGARRVAALAIGPRGDGVALLADRRATWCLAPDHRLWIRDHDDERSARDSRALLREELLVGVRASRPAPLETSGALATGGLFTTSGQWKRTWRPALPVEAAVYTESRSLI